MTDVSCHSCEQTYVTQRDYQAHATRPLVDNEGSFWFRCSCGASLTTPHEIPTWYSIIENVSPRSALLYSKIKDRYSIPRIPTSVMRLNQQLGDENATPEQIADSIKLDPIIAANVLRLANTYKQSGTGAITSLEHAVSFIGRTTIQELVIMAAIDDFDTERCQSFDMGDFWNKSIKTGRIAEILAKKFAPTIPTDTAYLAASLANLGKILMALVSPRSTEQIIAIQSSRSQNANWAKIEFDIDQNIDHKRMGEIAAALWGLPTYMGEICLEHHNLNKIMTNTDDGLDILDVSSISIQLGHLIFEGASVADETIIKRFAKRFALDQAAMKSLIVAINTQICR